MALGAHHVRGIYGDCYESVLISMQYNLCSPSWTEFLPKTPVKRPDRPLLYLEPQNLTVPPLASAAILSFLTLNNKYPVQADGISLTGPFNASGVFSISRESQEWGGEWQRCLSLGQADYDRTLCGAFAPGSIEGVWEGIFTVRQYMCIFQLAR